MQEFPCFLTVFLAVEDGFLRKMDKTTMVGVYFSRDID